MLVAPTQNIDTENDLGQTENYTSSYSPPIAVQVRDKAAVLAFVLMIIISLFCVDTHYKCKNHSLDCMQQ